jgi:hypothetical protein
LDVLQLFIVVTALILLTTLLNLYKGTGKGYTIILTMVIFTSFSILEQILWAAHMLFTFIDEATAGQETDSALFCACKVFQIVFLFPKILCVYWTIAEAKEE